MSFFASQSKIFPSALGLRHGSHGKEDSGFSWSNENLFWENCQRKTTSKSMHSWTEWRHLNWKDSFRALWKDELNSDVEFWDAYLKKVGKYELARCVISIFILSFIYRNIVLTDVESPLWESYLGMLMLAITASVMTAVSLLIVQLDMKLILAMFGMSSLDLWKSTSYLVLMTSWLYFCVKVVMRIFDANDINHCDPDSGVRIGLTLVLSWYTLLFFCSVPFPQPFALCFGIIKICTATSITSANFECIFLEFNGPIMKLVRLMTVALTVAAVASNHTCLTSARKVYQIQLELVEMQVSKNEIIDWMVSELTIPLQYLVSPLLRLLEDCVNPARATAGLSNCGAQQSKSGATTTGGYANICESISDILFHCHSIKLMASNTLLRTKLVEVRHTSIRTDLIHLVAFTKSVLSESLVSLNITHDFVWIESELESCHSDKVCLKALLSNLLHCASTVARGFKSGGSDTPLSRSLFSFSDHIHSFNSPAGNTLRSRSANMSANLCTKRAEAAQSSLLFKSDIMNRSLDKELQLVDIPTLGFAGRANSDKVAKPHVVLKFGVVSIPVSDENSSITESELQNTAKCMLEISLSFNQLEKAAYGNCNDKCKRICPIDEMSTVFLACKTIAKSQGGTVRLFHDKIVVTMLVRRTHAATFLVPTEGSAGPAGRVKDLDCGPEITSGKSSAWMRTDIDREMFRWSGGTEYVRVGVAASDANMDFIIFDALKSVGVRHFTHLENAEERLSDLGSEGTAGNNRAGSTDVSNAGSFGGETPRDSGLRPDADILVTSMPNICRDVHLKWKLPVILFYGGVDYLDDDVLQYCDFVVPIPCGDSDLNNLLAWLQRPVLNSGLQRRKDLHAENSRVATQDDNEEAEPAIDSSAKDRETHNSKETLLGSFDFAEKRYFGMQQFKSSAVEENYFVWIFMYSHDVVDYLVSLVLTVIILLMLGICPSDYAGGAIDATWRLMLPVGLLLFILISKKLYPLVHARRISLRKMIKGMIYLWVVVGVGAQIFARFGSDEESPVLQQLTPHSPMTFEKLMHTTVGTQKGYVIGFGSAYSFIVLCFCCCYYLPWPSHLVLAFFGHLGLTMHTALLLSVCGYIQHVYKLFVVSVCIWMQYTISIYCTNVFYRKEYQHWRVGLLTDEFLDQAVSSCMRDTKGSITAILNDRNQFLRDLKKGILSKRMLRSSEFFSENMTSLHKGFNHLVNLLSQMNFRDESIRSAKVALKPSPISSKSSPSSGKLVVSTADNQSSPFLPPPPSYLTVLDPVKISESVLLSQKSGLSEPVCVRRELLELLASLLSCESESVNASVQIHPMLTCVNVDKRVLQVCLRYAISQSIKNLRYRKRRGASGGSVDSTSIGAAAWGNFSDGPGEGDFCVRELVVVVEPFDRLKSYRFNDVRLMKLTVMDSGLLNEPKARRCINRLQCEELIRQFQSVDWRNSVDCPRATAEDCIFRVEPVRSDYYSCRFVCTIPYKLNSRTVFGRQAMHTLFGGIEPLRSLHKLLNTAKIRDVLTKCRANVHGVVSSGAGAWIGNHVSPNLSRSGSYNNLNLLSSTNNVIASLTSDNESDTGSDLNLHRTAGTRVKHGKLMIIFEGMAPSPTPTPTPMPVSARPGKTSRRRRGSAASSHSTSGRHNSHHRSQSHQKVHYDVNNSLSQAFASHGWKVLRTSSEAVLAEAIQHNDIDCVLYVEHSHSQSQPCNGAESGDAGCGELTDGECKLSVSALKFHDVRMNDEFEASRTRSSASNLDNRGVSPSSYTYNNADCASTDHSKHVSFREAQFKSQQASAEAVDKRKQTQRYYEFIARLRFMGFNKIVAVLLDSVDAFSRTRTNNSTTVQASNNADGADSATSATRTDMFDHVLVRPVLNLAMDELVDKIDTREVEILLRLYTPSFKLSADDG
jgi:hypothetical protein